MTLDKDIKEGNFFAEDARGDSNTPKRKRRRRWPARVGDKRGNNDHQAKPQEPAKKSSQNLPTGKYPPKDKNAAYAALDLGTNNCRLLVAKPTRFGFRVVDAFSRIVRLGEGVAQTGQLSDEAMDRTIEALKICADKLEHNKVTFSRNVATAACRDAANADHFMERIKAESGVTLDIISAAEEAKLAVMGCQSLIAKSNKHALVFDIGGGSTELIWVRVIRPGLTEIQGWTSIPWGVVNLTETYNPDGGDISEDVYYEMMDQVIEHLVAFEVAHNITETIKRRRVQFLGTSGTVTTLASVHLKLPYYIRSKVDGAWMQTDDIKALSRKVALMSSAEREAEPCIGAERADLVVAGCAILDAMLGTWSIRSLRVADRGIREGILRGLMKTDKEPRTARGITMV